mmetsp:Transcript_42475/g.98422  ORF Transcript_42475/g.98422 Transcript_42475/m.98422 type:complete len:234 (-) Transcript_42475:55-756(-)|eukprot:CAMPEP_0171095306 /NCGR_PEP_ID=MMETSP0766_2-20121228/43097_1 /TAXON_ID=439317 /ORGANISM="Gambierdiscus australes, Strain CAWD 149" /LENGTH=233 /DNA_ID=CAMNT_0011554097 /DNA_START=52 /DNA_END=753 /DNA_ORIENTATION=+
MAKRTIAASDDEFLTARLELLQAEKEFTKARDALAEKRRKLPWREVTKDYKLRRNGQDVSLKSLCAGPHESLIVVHFMFDPEWERGCPSCSFWADGYSANTPHLQQKAGLAVVAAAEDRKLQDLCKLKGWEFPMYSSAESGFNEDFGASFTQQQIDAKTAKFNFDKPSTMRQVPGVSVFKMQDGKLFHTYSCWGRGLDMLNTTYMLLDLLPDGRDEKHLPWTMAWVKHKEDYK